MNDKTVSRIDGLIYRLLSSILPSVASFYLKHLTIRQFTRFCLVYLIVSIFTLTTVSTLMNNAFLVGFTGLALTFILSRYLVFNE